MSHYLYILYSKTCKKYYVGETHNVNERISKHNLHEYSNSYSKITNDWELILSYECVNRNDALFIEKFIKKMKSKVFIEKIILNSNILTDILSKRQ